MRKATLKYGLWCEWVTAVMEHWGKVKGVQRHTFWAEWYWSLVEVEVSES